mgnify:CR=1 FL=1|jgi:hypothetical protein
MILKGEVVVKVSFDNLKVQANAFTSAVIIAECFKQIYARTPLTKSDVTKKDNFNVEVISKEIDKAY